ncbi:hypothetical protein FA15DRAFT_656085 [Coprinopsis marcescibilis]|uniref:N-acetyltransferase domain-containing protein n=1 Tax=Coprinopsis marcescibilis TaxID=230819 RepID=A0A5C3KUH4_COPMA|nr:hypothetical protein FA15DRAFT_656085 [Coprinopsis marcescibilis]
MASLRLRKECSEQHSKMVNMRCLLDKNVFTSAVTADDREFCGEFWGTVVIAGVLGGEVYFTEAGTGHDKHKRVIGVAVWFPPGRELYDSSEQQEKALGPMMARFGPDLQYWWGEDFLPKYESFTGRVLGEGVKLKSWHLQAIATDPDFQRQGVARAMIQIVKAKAARNRALLCLEVEDEQNLQIYKHIGWKVKEKSLTFKGLKGSFPMWVMVLEPPPKQSRGVCRIM